MIRILFIVGLALIIFGVRAMSEGKEFRSSNLKVTAEVLEISEPTKEARLPREGRVTVRYEHGGSVHRSSVTAHDKLWTSLKAGDKIELVLSEKNPSKFIPSASVAKSGYLGYALIGAGILFMVIGVYKRGA